MAIKSLGDRLGYVSIGDVRRAREREIRIESEKRGEAKGRKEERQKAEQEHLRKTLLSARILINKGVPMEVVVSSLSLTEEQVKTLL